MQFRNITQQFGEAFLLFGAKATGDNLDRYLFGPSALVHIVSGVNLDRDDNLVRQYLSILSPASVETTATIKTATPPSISSFTLDLECGVGSAVGREGVLAGPALNICIVSSRLLGTDELASCARTIYIVKAV